MTACRYAHLSLGVFLVALLCSALPLRETRADCVQNGLSVVCSGRDEDGFVSTQNDLNILVVPGALMRNFDTFERQGLCPIAFPSIATGNRATVTNQGFMFVRGVCGVGIQTGSQSTVINEDRLETLDILGHGIDVGAQSTVINAGRLVTNEFVAYGVFAGNESVITNRNGALILTKGLVASGINGGANVTVINDGTIQTTGSGSHAIDLLSGGQVTNSGLIEVNAFQAAGVRIRSGTGTISNSGAIRGTHTGNSNSNAPEDGMLLDVNSVAIDNSGTIDMASSSAAGIRVLSNGPGSIGIANSGSITAPGGGVLVSAAGGDLLIINDGTIRATGTGAAVSIDGSVALAQITNRGTLTAASGIALRGSDGRDEVTNSGTLDGGVFLEDGNDLLTLQNGAVIGGVLDGGGGTDELTLAGSGDINFAVSGFEELVKLGRGTWSLARDATFATRVRVLEDTLSIAASGRLTTAQMDIFPGTTLALAGTLVASFTNRGGFLITTGAVIDGDFAQTGQGSLRLTELEPTNAMPMLTVTGTATLSGQLDIPLANRAPVADGARVTILQAASVFGRFSSTNVTGGGFLTAEAVYGTQSVDVQFSRTPYRAVAATENARAVAIALDTALDGSPPETAFPLFTALDALPLDLAGDTLAALADDSPLTLHAMDRLAVRSLTQSLTDQAFESGLWGIADRQWSSIRNGAGQQLNRATTTVAAGATMDVTDTFTFGVMVGQSEYRASSRLAANRVDGQATQFGVSGAMRAGAWRAAAGIAIGTLDGASARDAVIAAGGLLATHSDGEFLSGDVQVAHASERANLHITVASGLTWAHVSRDAYDEVGGGLDRLSFTEINASSVRAHVSAKARAGLGRATPEVSARLSRELSGARILGQAALAVLPDTPFTLGLQAEKKTWLDLSGRIPFAVTPDFEIAVTGGGVINDAAGGHRIGLSATWRW